MITQPGQQKQSVWRAFLTPGWIVAALLALVFSWFAITTLSPWQLGKDHDIKERNERIEAAFEAEPVPLSAVVDGTAQDSGYDSNDEWTRVTMTGRYLTENEVLLRLRPVEGAPAFQSLVPFALGDPAPDGSTHILINRGWVPAGEGGTKVPTIDSAPSTTVTVVAMVRTSEDSYPTSAIEEQGFTMVQSINTAEIADLTGTALLSPYAQLLSDQPGVLNPIPLPTLDRGNHLSYGLQWIAFGIMAPAGLIYFIVSEVRERRRFREEQDELASLVDDPSPAAPPLPPEDGASSVDAAPQAPAPARARYGQTRRNPWAQKDDIERF